MGGERLTEKQILEDGGRVVNIRNRRIILDKNNKPHEYADESNEVSEPNIHASMGSVAIAQPASEMASIDDSHFSIITSNSLSVLEKVLQYQGQHGSKAQGPLSLGQMPASVQPRDSSPLPETPTAQPDAFKDFSMSPKLRTIAARAAIEVNQEAPTAPIVIPGSEIGQNTPEQPKKSHRRLAAALGILAFSGASFGVSSFLFRDSSEAGKVAAQTEVCDSFELSWDFGKMMNNLSNDALCMPREHIIGLLKLDQSSQKEEVSQQNPTNEGASDE